MQCTSLGSGSHSPFIIHVDNIGPLKPSPGMQLKVTLVPITTGMVCSVTDALLSRTQSPGFP